MSLTTDIGITSIEREELITRLRWLIRLRWFFGIGLIALGMTLWQVPRFVAHELAVAGVGVAILLYNAAFHVIERWLARYHPEVRSRRASTAASVQIVLDLIAITLVLHYAGGVENPFFIFYVFHIVIATLLLPARDVFLLAGFAIALYSGMVVGEIYGIWAHYPLLTDHTYYTDFWVVGLTMVAFASALMIAVLLGTSIARRLRFREQEIIELEMQVEEHAEELEEAYEKLQRLDEQKTRQYRLISHELKSPIAAQHSLLNATLIELNDHAPPPVLRRIRRAITRGDEVLQLLTDLLTLSNAREIAQGQRQEWIDPAEHLKARLEDRILQAKEKGVAFKMDIPPVLPAICVRPGMLDTLVDNLVSNAIKYTPEGGTVCFHMHCEGENLVIRVSDTGIGMSRDELKRVGQEFYRTNEAKSSGVGGTGLGMAIVRSLVEGVSGTWSIDSEPDEGTTVTASIPVVDPEGRQVCGLKD